MYTVIEIQKSTSSAVLTFTADSMAEAQKIYHEKLAFAAVSTVPFHKVILLGEMLEILREEIYTHPVI